MTGDSITEGDGNASAYRFQLFRRLYAAGVPFTFLGPNTSGDLRLPEAYYPHGGYCGITIGSDPEKDPGLMLKVKTMQAYADAVRDADIMILWIGYNDYNRKIDLEHITDRLTALIAEYHALNPDLILFVGTLFNYKQERAINAWILDPQTKVTLEKHFEGLTYNAVDMNAGECRLSREDNDFPEDDGHPAEKGNDKIGESWYRAIIGTVRSLSRSKTPDAPAPVRVSSVSGNLHNMTISPGCSVTFTASAGPAEAEVHTIIWHSDAPHIASVDDYGSVRTHNPGKAHISAVTLDGQYSISADITVTGESFRLEDGYSLLYSSDFADAAKWTGTTEVLAAEFNKLGIRYGKPRSGELVLNESVPCSNDFILSYTFRSANDRTHSPERWLSLFYAGLEIQMQGDAGCIWLRKNGSVLGEWKTIAPVASDDRYALKRDGNEVSVWRNQEFLFKASAASEPGDILRIVWNDMCKSDLRDIRISGK